MEKDTEIILGVGAAVVIGGVLFYLHSKSVPTPIVAPATQPQQPLLNYCTTSVCYNTNTPVTQLATTNTTTTAINGVITRASTPQESVLLASTPATAHLAAHLSIPLPTLAQHLAANNPLPSLAPTTPSNDYATAANRLIAALASKGVNVSAQQSQYNSALAILSSPPPTQTGSFAPTDTRANAMIALYNSLVAQVVQACYTAAGLRDVTARNMINLANQNILGLGTTKPLTNILPYTNTLINLYTAGANTQY